MNYLTLYRQWRPQAFGEVVGQKNTVAGLKNAVKEGRLSHAYLFFGPRGSGKTSLAKIMAKAVNCTEGSDGEPCNRCSTCMDINNGSFMDVMEIDAASNRGIDEIRDLREKVRVLPAQGKKKVYIIDEVHMLTTEAFNALLKTLEEPPPSVMFILATTEAHRLPATVLSRCQRYAFTRLSLSEVVQRLEEVSMANEINVTKQAMETMGRRANGSLRDALSILEQCIAFCDNDIDVPEVLEVLGMVNQEILADIMAAMLGQKNQEVLAHINTLIRQGKEPVQVARDAALCARDLMQYCLLGKEAELLAMPPDVLQKIAAAFPAISPGQLSGGIKHLLKLSDELRFNEGQRFLLEIGFLETMDIMGTNSGEPKSSIEIPAATPPTSPVIKEEIPETTPVGSWEEIKDKVKASKVTVHALLSPAIVVEMDEKVLTLGYRPDRRFHRDKMTEKGNLEILQAAITQVLGHPLEINLVILEETVKHSPAVRKAVEIFGEDKVKIVE
ncbi:MAG: DNA polymerase III subunit gamma/tau [Syntrophomonadaceae bacterium]|nr:DNA polymerase III subunit gamma/tau [Syntrophomonadaceae bacterium]